MVREGNSLSSILRANMWHKWMKSRRSVIVSHAASKITCGCWRTGKLLFPYLQGTFLQYFPRVVYFFFSLLLLIWRIQEKTVLLWATCKPNKINKWRTKPPQGGVDKPCQNKNCSRFDIFCSGALDSGPDLSSSRTIKRNHMPETPWILLVVLFFSCWWI